MFRQTNARRNRNPINVRQAKNLRRGTDKFLLNGKMSEMKIQNFPELKRAVNFCSFFCLLFFAVSAQAAWQPLGNITRVAQTKPNGAVLDATSRAKILIEFFDLNVVRIRVAPTGVFEPDFSYAIDYAVERKTPTARITQNQREIVLTNYAGARVVVEKTPFAVKIFDEAGNVVVADDKNKPTVFDRATGEIQTTKLRQSELETYYGFGEKAFAGMSRHGQFIVNWNTDTFSYPVGLDPIYQSVPFFFALYDGKSYGVFFNNTFRTYFDMGKQSPERYTFGAAGGELDYFVFTGGRERSPKNILRDYAALTGKTPLPPVWALGNQQSRWSYFPEKRVREIAAGFRKNKIPADVIYLDIDYMDGYRVFTWDKTRFPNPPKMLADLAGDGFKIVLIINPGIKTDEKYAVYADGKAKNVFVKNPDGTELNETVWAGNSAFPDFTAAAAREWYGRQFKTQLEEGVSGFWNDMNEPGVFMNEKTEKPEIFHHPDKTFPYETPHAGDGLRGTHRRYHNVYGMQMARATFEGLRKLAPEKRPFGLTRAGFAGIQRFSAVWTGDNYASWEHLALTIPMLSNLSVSGVPFVGADVGGFNDMPTGELYSRWLQAAALTPFLRSHSVGWVGNKEPWEFGEEFTRINRATIELRYQFLPYLYTLFREHERAGEPVMRPLWYEYPQDKMTYLVDDQYLVGRDVLVAPVVKQGIARREVYFPAGDDWLDWQTGERFEGGKKVWIQTPLEKLPLFVRIGAVVPTQAVIQHTGEMPNAPVTLHVAAGIAENKTENSMLYQDAGDGYGYRRSDWREIKIQHRRGSLMINREGNFQGQKIKFVEAVGIAQKPREIRVDGKVLSKFDFDEKEKRLRFEIDENAKEISLIR
jgi:alpha-glucosidase